MNDQATIKERKQTADLYLKQASTIEAQAQEIKRLRGLLKDALVMLDNMTTDQFHHGKDKPVRDAIRAELEKQS